MAQIKLTEEESFDLVNSKFNNNYYSVLNNMSFVSEMIKKDPENLKLKEMLGNLAETAADIISSQISFVYSYGDKKYIDNMVDNLLEKRKNLLQEVSNQLNGPSNIGRGR